MGTLSFNPPLNLVEEGKWLLGVTSFEATNSAVNITNENKSFLFSILGHWNSEDGEDFINKLYNLLELKSENDIELHVKEIEKRGTRIEIDFSGYNLAGFDHFKSETLSELNRVKNRDLEDMVYRLHLTYDEIADILDVKYITGSTKECTLAQGIYEVTDFNMMFKSVLLKDVKVKLKFNDFRLNSNLTTIKTMRFTKKSFFYTMLGFTKSHSGVLGDISGFVQLIPGSYKSDKPINISGRYKSHLKRDCLNGSIINGNREPILFSFALSSPARHKKQGT